VTVLNAFLAIVGLLVGLRVWPIVIHTLFWLSGLALAKHDTSGPSEAFTSKVTRVVLAAAGAWVCFFGGIAVLVSYMSAHPGAWVALFLGVTLASCFAVVNYLLTLRRLRTTATAVPDSRSVKPTRVRTFLKWASSSLVGHIALFQLLGALPMFILFVYLNYSEGTLTFSWGIWIAFVAGCFGLFMALFFWFTLSRWFVYLRRDTDAMRALLAKKRR
jgi:hypothetical protein